MQGRASALRASAIGKRTRRGEVREMRRKRDESGVLFVEAAIVFPIMFIIIFLMIYLGNFYWQRSKVEAVTAEYAARGAAYCADPLLIQVSQGSIPSVSGHQVYPYRVFDPNGVGSTVEDIAGELDDKITGIGSGLFKGMEPKDVHVVPQYHNGVIYSTFSVDVDYKIELPIRMIGESENYSIKMSSHIELPVTDVPEMIRTVDMVEDYLEQLGVTEAVGELTEKLSQALGKAKDWMGF